MKRSLYLLFGALSGALWYLIPLTFEGGWAIPSGFIGRLAGLAAAIVTGVAVSLVFAPTFRRSPRWLFLLLPFLTLPVAIGLFAFFLWLARLSLGEHFFPRPVSGDLYLLFESYIYYGLFGLFMPLLFGLALVNQFVMAFLLDRDI